MIPGRPRRFREIEDCPGYGVLADDGDDYTQMLARARLWTCEACRDPKVLGLELKVYSNSNAGRENASVVLYHQDHSLGNKVAGCDLFVYVNLTGSSTFNVKIKGKHETVVRYDFDDELNDDDEDDEVNEEDGNDDDDDIDENRLDAKRLKVRAKCCARATLCLSDGEKYHSAIEI